MTNEEIRLQLKSLRDHCKSMSHQDEPDDIWARDVAALTAAIEILDNCDWRRERDELPVENGEPVLAIASGKPMPTIELINTPVIAEYWAGDGWEIPEYPEWDDAQVTHWMPLPEPPEPPEDIYDAEMQRGENHD